MSNLPAKPGDKRYWLILSIVLITILCTGMLLVERKPVNSMLVYPYAHLNPNLGSGCGQTNPIRIWQVNTKKDWAVSSSSRSCFTTNDTADQVLDWYQQAGWHVGGSKAPGASRTTYYVEWMDLGIVSIELFWFEGVTVVSLPRGNMTLIDDLAGYSLILHFR